MRRLLALICASRVYLVGEADFVAAAFTTRAAAEKYLELRRDSDDWWVEAVPLDPPAAERSRT